MLTRYFNNVAHTVLSSGVTIGETIINVASTGGYPTAPFTIAIDRGSTNQEVCLVTVVLGSTQFQVTRNYDLADDTIHAAGAIVEMASVAQDFLEANDHQSIYTEDVHTQYLLTDGFRHDETALHLVGTTLTAGLPTPSFVNDVTSEGVSTLVSCADHLHDRTQDISTFLPVGFIFYTPPTQVLSTIVSYMTTGYMATTYSTTTFTETSVTPCLRSMISGSEASGQITNKRYLQVLQINYTLIDGRNIPSSFLMECSSEVTTYQANVTETVVYDASSGNSPIIVLPLGTWLPCDGSIYSTTDYPALYAEIGTQYSTGLPLTQFQVPDMSIRVVTSNICNPLPAYATYYYIRAA
jgi:hypothetical protein